MLRQISGWTFGLGSIWLLWNIATSLVGGLIGSDTLANSPFGATPTAWLLSLGLVGIGIVTSALDKK